MRSEDGLDFAGSVIYRVLSGSLTREAAELVLSEKLSSDCPACTANYDTAIAGLYGPLPLPGSGLPPGPRTQERMMEFIGEAAPTRVAGSRNAGHGGRARRGALSRYDLTDRAQIAVEGLKLDRWARRRERVTLEWHRFRGSAVAGLFLLEARAALPGSAEDSARWAELALLALGGCRSELYPSQEEKSILRLRARLFQANALRCLGDLQEAHEEFALTLSIGEELDLRCLEFWAEAKSFLASLRRAQRDLPSAVREARAGAALARATGSEVNEARSRWQLASIYELLGDFNSALLALRQALPTLPGIGDPVLEMGLRHAEVHVLARSGQNTEAARAFEALAPLYARFPDRENFRLWVSGIISAGLSGGAEVETVFRAARDGFLAAKNPYDAALVTLDWTLFLLEQDRAEEVLPLAVSMGQAFEGLGVAREALASWNVFAEAAARRELTRTAAEGLVRSLGTERSAPQRGR